ncbi:MAG TPA: type II CAAX endopeptidase family protein [Dehalococcoidia bacterium]|nr:type II CAAX endopeptidase family protein [Dehalococcoidia bacterium]
MFAEFSPQTAENSPRPSPRRRWRVRDMLYGIGLLVGSLALVTVALVAANIEEDSEAADFAAGVSIAAFELLFGGAVVWLAYRRRLRLPDLGFVRPHHWGPAAIAWAGAYLILVVYALLLGLLSAIGVDVGAFEGGNELPVDVRNSAGVALVFALAVVVIAPFSEELFFRALLFRGMQGYWRFWPSMLVSGFAFGLFHGNLSVIAPFAAIGALFAWANARTGSLWTSITAHAGINGVSFALSLLVEP